MQSRWEARRRRSEVLQAGGKEPPCHHRPDHRRSAGVRLGRRQGSPQVVDRVGGGDLSDAERLRDASKFQSGSTLYAGWYPMFYVSSSSRYIAVGRTGTVYVTDYADGKLYAVTVGSLNV